MSISSLTIGSADYPVYATPTEADEYLAIDPVRGPGWNVLDEAGKGQRLAMAARRLDLLDWIGVKTDATQSLQWPRQANADGTLLNINGQELAKDALPVAVERASILLAGDAATNNAATTLTPINPRIEMVKAGPTATKFWHPNIVSVHPNDIRLVDPEVFELIEPYLALPGIATGAGATQPTDDSEAVFRRERFPSVYPYGGTTTLDNEY